MMMQTDLTIAMAMKYEEDGASDAEPINPSLLTVGSITTVESVNSSHSYSDRIFATVKLNDMYDMKMKVDTAADTCIITVEDLQLLPFMPEIKPCYATLKGHGGGKIHNVGAIYLKVSFEGNSIQPKFTIVDAPETPSTIGCKQSQQLGIGKVNIHDIAGPNSKTPILLC